MNNNTFNLLLLHPPLSLVTGRLSWYCAEWGVYCFHPVLLEALRQAVFLMFATSCSFSDMTTWRDVSEKTSWGKSEALWRRAAPPTVDAKCEPKVNIWLSLSIHYPRREPPQLPKSSRTQVQWCKLDLMLPCRKAQTVTLRRNHSEESGFTCGEPSGTPHSIYFTYIPS